MEALKKLNLEGFDWSSRHETGQTLLVRCIHKAMTQLTDKSGNTLETIEWLIRSGASMEQKCTGGKSNFGLTEKPEQPCIRVECRGHNAISYVWAVQRGMRQNLEHWNYAASFLTKILETFAEASVQKSPARPRVSIDAGIAELWEKSLAAKESHNLTIETADGLVTAHAHMLKAASSVVAAMLESPMKEGQAQRIEIKDASSKAVSLFLEILGVVSRYVNNLVIYIYIYIISYNSVCRPTRTVRVSHHKLNGACNSWLLVPFFSAHCAPQDPVHLFSARGA